MSAAILPPPQTKTSQTAIQLPTVRPTTVQPERAKSIQVRLETLFNSNFADLQQHYQIDNEQKSKIYAFLNQHRHLLPVLQEGVEVINLLFGEETEILLYIQRDPEIGQESLVAWVQNDLEAREAIDRLMELNETWFGERLAIVGESLTFLA